LKGKQRLKVLRLKKMNDLEEIKNRIDIVDFIGGYVQLKQSGRNFKAVCPFHSEKTPSFMVSRERQIWRCFGSCNEGGDIFSFLMKMEGLSFGEVLKSLADKAGVSIRPVNIAKKDAKVKIFQINETTAQFFHKMLLETPNGEKAMQYLLGRGLTKETIKTFLLGWAPEPANFLSSFLLQKGFSKDDILKAGLATEKNSKMFDFFRGRIVFPLRTAQGSVAGFTGRHLTDDSFGPKYLNSPPTPVFEKSSLLFGFEEAKQEIRQKNEAILVEGNMDVLACFQEGIKNVVASCGTALTEIHLDLLGRFTSNLSICFDSDEAGEKATARAIEMAEPKDLNVKVISISFAKDPADAIKKDPTKFKKTITEAQYAVDYLFGKIFDKNDIKTALGKKQIAKEALLVIKKISNLVEKYHYLKILSKKLDVAEDLLIGALDRSDKKGSAQKTAITPKAISKKDVEEKILGLVLSYPQFFEILVRHLQSDDFSDEFKSLYKPLLKFYTDNSKLDLQQFGKNLSPDTKRQIDFLIIDSQNRFVNFSDDEILTEIFLYVRRIKGFQKDDIKKELLEGIKKAESEGDIQTSLKLLSELQKIISE